MWRAHLFLTAIIGSSVRPDSARPLFTLPEGATMLQFGDFKIMTPFPAVSGVLLGC